MGQERRDPRSVRVVSGTDTRAQLPDRPLLTIEEAAAYLGVSRATGYRWASQGVLPVLQTGPHRRRVPRAQLQTLLGEVPAEADVGAG